MQLSGTPIETFNNLLIKDLSIQFSILDWDIGVDEYFANLDPVLVAITIQKLEVVKYEQLAL